MYLFEVIETSKVFPVYVSLTPAGVSQVREARILVDTPQLLNTDVVWSRPRQNHKLDIILSNLVWLELLSQNMQVEFTGMNWYGMQDIWSIVAADSLSVR